MWYNGSMQYTVTSSYCKKRRGQDTEHDRCYGRQDVGLSCTCPCHDKKENA